jgi:hypothetical protein
MALISLGKAADRVGVSCETIESWVSQGLLTIHIITQPSAMLSGTLGVLTVERCVDEEQLVQVAESLGWLHLSSEGWDGAEED